MQPTQRLYPSILFGDLPNFPVFDNPDRAINKNARRLNGSISNAPSKD